MVNIIEKLKNNEIFIPGNVPSLKNGKIKTERGIFSSKTVKKYLRSFGISSYSASKKDITYYKKATETPFCDCFNDTVQNLMEEARLKNTQVIMSMHFIRGTRHKFDFINAAQIIADIMVAYDMIDDDNMDNLILLLLKINNK